MSRILMDLRLLRHGVVLALACMGIVGCSRAATSPPPKPSAPSPAASGPYRSVSGVPIDRRHLAANMRSTVAAATRWLADPRHLTLTQGSGRVAFRVTVVTGSVFPNTQGWSVDLAAAPFSGTWTTGSAQALAEHMLPWSQSLTEHLQEQSGRPVAVMLGTPFLHYWTTYDDGHTVHDYLDGRPIATIPVSASGPPGSSLAQAALVWAKDFNPSLAAPSP